jgi:pimeloyl-ACP methyl ester carboxylesterase
MAISQPHGGSVTQPVEHFDEAGPIGAPAVVLVHGSVVTRKMWLPQLQHLSDSYHVLAPDLPGHGALARLPFTFASAAQSLHTLIEGSAGGRAIVVGASMGGYVAIELAHRFPQSVAGLVLAGASRNLMGAVGLYVQIVGGLMRRGWIKMSAERAAERTRKLFPPALADVAAAQLRAGVYPEPLGAAFAEMAGRDFQLLLADFPGPTLIINGARDTGNRRSADRFARAARQATVVTLLDAGHACSIDRPDAFSQAVRQFAKAVFA